GERPILSPATCFTPGCRLAGACASPLTTASGMDLVAGSVMGCVAWEGSGARGQVRRRGLLDRQAELGCEVSDQRRLDRVQAGRTAQVYNRGHLQPCVATRVDALERRQVHVDVERQAMERAAAADADAEGRDLGTGDVDPRRTLASHRFDVPVAQRVDD